MSRPTWFLTVSCRRIFPAVPSPDLVALGDIAHALSLTNRFGGHTVIAYSVAQHSVHVSRLCKPEHALIGLLHDATEYVLGDVISPVKALLPSYEELERRWAMAIGERFGLGDRLAFLPDDVKVADTIALDTEKRDLRLNPWEYGGGGVPRNETIVPHPRWQDARDEFLTRFAELCAAGGLEGGPRGTEAPLLPNVNPGRGEAL